MEPENMTPKSALIFLSVHVLSQKISVYNVNHKKYLLQNAWTD